MQQHPLDYEKYFAMSDLAEAASLIRSDAANYDIDPVRAPQYPNLREDFYMQPRVSLPTRTIEPDVNDRAYFRAIKDEAKSKSGIDEDVAILLVSRPLSVDELASLLENRIRVYQELSAGYIIRGPKFALRDLEEKDYCRWLGKYQPEDKHPIGFVESQTKMYGIECFHRQIDEAFLADLASLGVEVTSLSPTFGIIGIRASWKQVALVEQLLWLKSITGEIEVSDDGGWAGSYEDSGDKVLAHSRVLAQNSKILAGRIALSGVSGIVGIVEPKGLQYTHHALFGNLIAQVAPCRS